MSRVKLTLWICAALVASATCGVDAQTVRLRPVSSIYVDAKGTAIAAPEGVAYDGKSLVVVADSGNRRLIKYSLTEESASAMGEISLREVPYPMQVRIDSTGRILVLDGKSRRIAVLGSDDSFQGYLQLDPAPGQNAVNLKSFDLDRRDNVYVLDVTGARILVLSPEGQELRTIAFSADVGFVSGIAVSASGSVFAVDSVEHKIWVARKNDDALSLLAEISRDEVEFPTHIAADAVGSLFISDQYNGGIAVFGQDGTFHGRQSKMGWTEGFLRYPTGLSVANGLLFVADRGNNRIQEFELF